MSALVSVRELSELFPDLLPPYASQYEHSPDYYETLGVLPSKPTGSVVAAFMCKARQVLTKSNGTNLDADAYMKILDAGFVLRKARLRVSHDLVVCRNWLIDKKTISPNGNLASIEQPKADQVKEKQEVEQSRDTIAKPPLLIQMLVQAGIIGQAEVAALTAQRSRAPEVPIERLVLDSGYVVQAEMNSLKLAEDLILRGRITMAQFQVAMYDERNSGIRMAESLQVRGWLPR